MDDAYDVAVAGGGFAGLQAARACAERGATAVVFERSDEIGYPIHTSGGSFVSDLERLDVPEELYHPVETVAFHAPTESATFDYRSPKFCVIDVRGVRQHLAETAVAAGASVYPDTTVTDAIVSETGGVEGLTVQHDGDTREVRAAVTIDGTGFQSVIAQAAGLHDGFERFGRGIEYDLYAPAYDSTTALLVVGETLIPDGYGWVFPYDDDRVRVGVGSLYPDADADLRGSIDRLLDEYRSLGLRTSARIETHAGVIPSEGVPDRTVGDGVVLAGDAANFPFGVVGEGIRMALDTGRVAGRVAADAVAAGSTDRSALREYETYWQSEYGTSLDVSYAINRRLAGLDDDDWDGGTRILQSLDPEDFYHLMRCDFEPRELARLWLSNPRLIGPLGKELLAAVVDLPSFGWGRD